MEDTMIGEIENLKNKKLEELQKQFEELFGKKTDSANEIFIRRKIAYRIQEQELGELSKKAKSLIAELIEKYDPVNNQALRPKITTSGKELKALPSMRDKRLPIPNTIIRKKYKDQDIEVRVLEKGLEYNGKRYRSLTAIALEITGCHWNGYSFFNV